MRLYRTATGAWAGTQADAGKGHTQIEVPTDKAGLLDWLNANAQTQRLVAPPIPVPGSCVEVARPLRDMDATATLSRMESGAGVDAMVETISKARGYTLKRFAGAVALAFGAL